jgi:hypothetical protein
VPASEGYAPICHIHDKVTNLKAGGISASAVLEKGGMAQSHPYPCQKLGHPKRLGQVVIRAGIERVHFVGFLIPRGEDHHGHLRPTPHLLKYGSPVDIR